MAAASPLHEPLLAWYDREKRDLPWRRGVSPYRTWVSEIMLQQTTVKTVLPYFKNFIREFPNTAALASAREEQVLKSWAGLGYYSRARHLQAAARKIMSEHGGKFPSSYEDVLALPGIGRYTAGAILSIAFAKPHPVLDGNVARVFARLFAIQSHLKKPSILRQLWEKAENLLSHDRPGDWNQALMELGATLCLPENPNCQACPVQRHCAAFQKGWQNRLPVTAQRRPLINLKWTCLWIEKDGRVLLWERSAQERFLKGHWGLPEARHLKTTPGPLMTTVRHTITQHKITLAVAGAAAPAALPPQAAWVPKARLQERLVSSLWLKCL